MALKDWVIDIYSGTVFSFPELIEALVLNLKEEKGNQKKRICIFSLTSSKAAGNFDIAILNLTSFFRYLFIVQVTLCYLRRTDEQSKIVRKQKWKEELKI